MRHKLGLFLVAIVVATFCSMGMMDQKASAEVQILMDWIYSGKHAPYFVARDKGFWKKAGVDVKILQGRGSGKSAAWVDTKKVEYSYGDFGTMLKGVSKGMKNMVVGAVHVFQTGCFISMSDYGIRKPKDLEGKIFGGSATDFGRVLMPAMAAASGFDMNKITLKSMKPAVRTPALFEGKIHFFSGTRGSSCPRMTILAKRNGRKASHLYFKDMGLESYGHMLQVHRDRIKSHPKEVQSVVSGTFDAFAWSIKNTDGAFDVYIKANPNKDKEITRVQLQEMIVDVQDPEVISKGLGYMKESMVRKSVATANKYFKLSPQVDYKKVYTNKFIRPNPGL